MTSHLVIPDAHAKPGCDKRRFSWLGKLIVDVKPDKIICLGDFADMESLCSYDKGKKSYNGRRYKADIESAVAAQEAMFKPLREYNANRAANHRKRYRPELHMCLGNHEYRISRAIELDHVLLEGLIGVEDLKYEEFGWSVYPFLDILQLDGIAYSHYFVSGVMGRAISGEHPAATLLRKQMMSCTAGHSHIFDMSRRTRADGRHIRGLIAGCYFDHYEPYAGPANDLWWRGVFLKTNVKKGDYDLQEFSIQELKRRYG